MDDFLPDKLLLDVDAVCEMMSFDRRDLRWHYQRDPTFPKAIAARKRLRWNKFELLAWALGTRNERDRSADSPVSNGATAMRAE